MVFFKFVCIIRDAGGQVQRLGEGKRAEGRERRKGGLPVVERRMTGLVCEGGDARLKER